MICCKIVTNYNSEEGSFGRLCDSLSKKGEFIWNNGSLYFADCYGKINSKDIKRIVKKNGYGDCFIDEYTKENPPQHETEFINGWLTDKIVKINYSTYEQVNQQLFKNISRELDQLDKTLDSMIEKKRKDAGGSDEQKEEK